PAKDEDLHKETDHGERGKARGNTEKPQPSRVGDFVAEIGAEEIKRDVRKIDVAHQPEDEREAGGDEKIKSRQRYAVEERIDECLFRNKDGVEPCRPDRNEKPGDQGGGEHPNKGPRLP